MENKSWKNNNTLVNLKEKIIEYVQENEMDDMTAIEYIGESLDIDLDSAYSLLLESRRIASLSEEEITKIYDEAARVIPVANVPDRDGMVVAPASWRDV